MHRFLIASIKLGVLCLFALVLFMLPPAIARANPKTTPPFSLGPIFYNSPMPQAAVGQSFGIANDILSYQDINWVQGGYPIDIDIVEVHHEGNPGHCSQAAIKVYTMQSPPYDKAYASIGAFWPSAATSTAFGSPYYAACLHQELPAGMTSPDLVSGTVADIGTANIFQVVNDIQPSYRLSATTIPYGSSLNIYGSNWLPYIMEVNNLQVACRITQFHQDSETMVIFAVQQANVDAQGNFVITFPITSSYPVSTYNVSCGSVDFNRYTDFGQALKIVASLPPTATPARATPTTGQTPTPQLTATPTISNGGVAAGVTPTPLAQIGATNSTSTASGTSPANSSLLLVLIAVVLALVALFATIGIRYFRRNVQQANSAKAPEFSHESYEEPTQSYH